MSGRLRIGVRGALFALFAASFVVSMRSLMGDRAPSDHFADGVQMLVAVLASAILAADIGSDEGASRIDRAIFLLGIAFAVDVAASARNLLVMYVAIESAALFTLLASDRDPDARRARIVPIAVGSAVMLYGMSLLFGFTRSLDYARVVDRVASSARASDHFPHAVLFGALCVVAGLAQRIGAAPFHRNGGARGTFLFATLLRIGALAAIARFFAAAIGAHVVTASDIETPWPIVVGAIALVSITIGSLSAIAEANVPKLVRSLTIAHAGVMLAALSTFSREGDHALVRYAASYALMTLGLVVVVEATKRAGPDETLDAFRGLGSRAPLRAATMTALLLALAGLPPFAGFAATIEILGALVTTGGAYKDWYVFLALACALHGAVALAVSARVVKQMYLPPREPIAARSKAMSAWSVAAIAIVVPPVIALGIDPNGIHQAIDRIVAALAL